MTSIGIENLPIIEYSSTVQEVSEALPGSERASVLKLLDKVMTAHASIDSAYERGLITRKQALEMRAAHVLERFDRTAQIRRILEAPIHRDPPPVN